MPAYKSVAKIQLPVPHEKQRIFVDWETLFPKAQCLVIPAGTKVGKTFGASIWLLSQALANPNYYCVWIAPTLFKCRIAYRYMKAMLPDVPWIKCVDGALEITIGTSTIKFLHGRDAEVTVEGEAVDAFVIDESGKQNKQLWFSLFTTITQTGGKGIITGTPRGSGHWYHSTYKQALEGDPFFCHGTLRTIDSPFISEKAVEHAKRILPKHLFDQYYLAMFTSESSVYGDLSAIWDEGLVYDGRGLWLHPDEAERAKPVCVGYDIAKRRDYSVFYATNVDGKTVGYCRFKNRPYPMQASMLAKFCRRFPAEGNELRYDRTGVGDAVGDLISESMDGVGDWSVKPVVFTNASKQELVSLAMVAIDERWFRAPRIPRIETEFGGVEVKVTKTGLHTYSAPDGEHDDVHWAACLSISGARAELSAASHMDMIEAALSGNLDIEELEDDDINVEDDDLDALLQQEDDQEAFEGEIQ